MRLLDTPAFGRSLYGQQPSQSDGDEPTDRGLRRQAAGGCERMQAVARKLIRGHVVPKVAGPGALGKQLPDHGAKLLLGSADVLAPMQECREFLVVLPMGLVRDLGVGLQHTLESLPGIGCLVPGLGKLFEVGAYLPLVPGEQDRFDVREVLVQSRPADARLLGNLRHRH